MGTTLLDSAKIGKPCIPVNTYTYEMGGTYYWCDNPHFLVATGSPCYEFNRLIDELINMDFVKYNELSLKTYECFNKYYEINTVMNGVLNYISNQRKIRHNILLMSLINFLFRITCRLKRLVDSCK